MTGYDDPHGDVLARVLATEARTIVPAGDGLTRIRARVEARRSRLRWVRPLAALATAGAAAGIAFGAWNAASTGTALHQTQLGKQGPSSAPTTATTPSVSPTTTTTAPVNLAYTPLYAEAAGDPGKVATDFAEHVGVPAGFRAILLSKTSTDATVALSDRGPAPGGGVSPFTTVHLLQVNGQWAVMAADAPGIAWEAPKPGAQVGSPVALQFTSQQGVDEQFTVTAWSAGTTGAALPGQTSIPFGQGPAKGSLSFTAPGSGGGFLLAVDQSGKGDGSIARLAAVPVTFGGAPAVAGPRTWFVAAKDGRIGIWFAKSGGFDRWLTSAQPGGGASSPQVTADGQWVYFLQGCGNSCQSLMKVSTAPGSSEQTVVDGAKQGIITAFAVGGDHGQFLAYATNDNGQGGILTWTDQDTNQTGSFQFKGVPPEIEQLAWAPDGVHLAAQVRGGMQWSLQIYDTTASPTLYSGTAVPCRLGDGCSAPAYDASGMLYFVEASDATHWELLQWTGSEVKHVSTFTVGDQAGSPENATVSISPDAQVALVTTGGGKVYRIEHGKAAPLTTVSGGASW